MLAVIILSFYIQSVRNEVAKNKITVWKLTKNVRPGDPLKPKDWEAVEVPAQFRDSFEAMTAIVSASPNDDSTLKSLVKHNKDYQIAGFENGIITTAMFDSPDELEALKIDDGKVRIALPIKSKTTPGGLRPGMHVDLAAPMLTGGQITQTMKVMHNVRIKAVGSTTIAQNASGSSRSTRSYSTISIDVDPGVALMLSTLEKMVRATGEFEIHIAPQGDRLLPDIKGWNSESQINPQIVELVKTNLPSS